MTNFKPMLAVKARLDKLTFPLLVQPKLDGIRCSIVGGVPLTRKLKDVPNREIRAALSHPAFEGLDGEVIVGEPTAEDCYRRTASFTMSFDKTGEPWTLYVFDLWNSPSAAAERLNHLEWMFQRYRAEGIDAHLKLVPRYIATSYPSLEEIEAGLVAEGHEGVIARDPDGLYKFGRASVTAGELLKIKRFDDFEAEVVGVYEEQHNGNEAKKDALGRTERSSAQSGKVGKGRLGGLILVGRTAYEGVEFRCGTGFDAADRDRLWQEAASLTGKLAKIKHFPVGAKDKPRFPTFLGWRDVSDL